MNQIFIEEDLRLKSLTSSLDPEQHYDWPSVIGGLLKESEGETNPRLHAAAVTIGQALTDLLRSQGCADINTESNRRQVAALAVAVEQRLVEMADFSQPVADLDMNTAIEQVLVEQNSHDVARSLVHQRAARLEGDHKPSLMTVKLIRRNGQVVPWIEQKIEVAVRKAFLALKCDSSPAVAAAQAVSLRVSDSGCVYIRIEEVQDMVQEVLMSQGHYKVAENFILYRAHRAQQRADQAGETSNTPAVLQIRQADGSLFDWRGTDLQRRLDFALIDLDLCLTREQIELELRRSLFDGMSAEELRSTLLLNAKSLMEKDADFARFAGRILLTYIYEEVLDWDICHDGVAKLKAAHQQQFEQYLRRAVALERLDASLLTYDLKKMSSVLDPAADLDFDYLGIQTLYDRYLLVDKSGEQPKRLETPQFFWMRVAMGLFIREDDKGVAAQQLYSLYKSRRFCSSTPTLFNSGTKHSQLSSCYLYSVEDSLESIMQRGIAENAYLSKWAGGLGGSWSAVRGTGAHIAGTNGESQGIIPFLKLHNDQLVAVNQGGKRRGSGCAYLETWHNDLMDFLELRRNTGDDRRRAHDMNTANWIPDLFMKRMEAREDWSFFHSNEVPELHDLYGRAFEEEYLRCEARAAAGEIFVQIVPAIDVWKKMLRMLFETGHPWITFKDPCNVRSPQDHTGMVHSSNLCTEITLNTSAEETAVCNLGSVLIDNHITESGELDHKKLQETIRIAIRALDNVIDINFYPTEAAKCSNMRHRPIGLGVMGLQNALYKQRIPFDSDESVEFSDVFMEAVAYYAYEASSDLAAERGCYSSYEGSKWSRGLLPQDTISILEEERGLPVDVPRGSQMDWRPLRDKIKTQGMRNSNVLAIAPTATISNIMGTTPCIEPHYKNLYVKSNLGGEFIVLNRGLVQDLKRRGLWTRDMIDQLKYFDGELEMIEAIPDDLRQLHKTVFAIPYERFIDAAARRQKWIDQAQSLNLFLAEPDLKTLSHMYRQAWRSGLKTTYYLRTLGASNIEKSSVSIEKEKRSVVGSTPAPTPESVQACSIEAMMNGGECEACQ